MDKSHNIHAAIMTASQVQLITVKVWHAMAGLYTWEYLTTLEYEWRVIRGHLPYRWTIWIYSFARLAALTGVILSIVIQDVTTQINCQFWGLFSAILLLLSAVTASLLIVLRTMAIWNRKKVVVMLATIVWGILAAFHLYSITLTRSAWSTQLGCVRVKGPSSIFSYILSIIADMAMLLIILTSLLVLRRGGGGTFGLTRVVWKQGIIWLVIAFAAEIPLLVFTLLHFSDQLQNLLVAPSHIILTIAATRMHRALVDFASGSFDEAHEGPQVSDLVFSKTKTTDTSTALDRVEVTIHMAVEQHPTSRTSNDDSSTIIGTRSASSLPTVSPSRSPSPSIPQALTQSI